MTGLSEQEIIVHCYNRRLVRPDIPIKKIAKNITLAVVFSGLFALIFCYGLKTVSYHNAKPLAIIEYQKHNPVIFFFWVYVCVSVILVFVLMKKILITVVELYQHFAPDNVRKRCICLPSCSEYAILVLKKYNIVIALRKIYIRLFKTCSGNSYKLDYP